MSEHNAARLTCCKHSQVLEHQAARGERVERELRGVQASESLHARKADHRTREVGVVRGQVAAKQLELSSALAELQRCRESERAAVGAREKSEREARALEQRLGLEQRAAREAGKGGRRLQEAMQQMRRGVVGLALVSGRTRLLELALAAALSRWRAVALVVRL